MRRGLDGTKNFLRYDKRRPCSAIFLAFSGAACYNDTTLFRSWGIDPLAVSRLGRTAKKPPFTKKELARIGIPAHKIPRVQEELARLTADKILTREELGRLAEEISWLLL
mgnify:CR=1 FL=1